MRLIRRGQAPVNSVQAGPAQVARDEAIALELQRRMAIQAAMEENARASRAQQQQRQQPRQQPRQQQPRLVAQAQPRARNEGPSELPPPGVMMTDPILDTFEAIGNTARDNMLQLWDKMNGRPSRPRTTRPKTVSGGYQAVSTTADDEEEDEDEIAFDSSLT